VAEADFVFDFPLGTQVTDFQARVTYQQESGKIDEVKAKERFKREQTL